MLRAADLQISSIQNRILVIVLQLQIAVDQVACSIQKFHLLNDLLCIFALLFLSIYESYNRNTTYQEFLIFFI